MNNILKRIYENDKFPFIILFILELFAHIFMTMTYGDDTKFQFIYQDQGVINRIIWNYYNWSTRFVIEGVLYNLYRFPFIIWKILDSSMLTLIGYSMSEIFIQKNKRENNWLIVCMVLTYPLMHMMTAGWMATSTGYTWVVALGLFAMSVLRQAYVGDNVSFAKILLGIVSLFYATNAEQSVCVLLAWITLILLYCIKRKEVKKINYVYFILALLMFLFKITAPSNDANVASHIAKYDIDFQMMGIVDKIYNGFWTTAEHYFYHFNIISCFMVGAITLGIFIVRKDLLYKVLAGIPLLFVVIIPIIVAIPSSFSQIRAERYLEGISLENFQRLGTYVPFAIYIIIFLNICINIYIFYGNNIKSACGIMLFVLGFGGRMVMGFTPSLFASATRTFCITYFSFIALTVMIVHDLNLFIQKDIHKNIIKSLDMLIIFSAVISYFKIMLSL